MTPPVWALIDTGASLSCIDKAFAVQCKLPIHGIPFTILGVSGRDDVNRHLGQIHIPLLNTTIYGLFPAVDLSGQNHKVIIGRAFLESCVMTYNGMTGDVQIDYTPISY